MSPDDEKVTIKKDFKTDEVEVVEEEVFAEEEEVEETLVAAKGSVPLVNGFRNKTVILPLAVLQKRISVFEDSMQKAFEGFQQQVTQQVQFAFQYSGQIAKRMSELELAAEAMARLANINDDDLEVEIENVRKERAADREKKQDEEQGIKVVDRAAKEGDIVKIDFVGTIDGEKFDGGEAEGHVIKLGAGSFIPGFEEQLIGAKAGDVVDVTVTFPKDYGKKPLAGKSADFKTTMVAVKEQTVVEEVEEELAKAE